MAQNQARGGTKTCLPAPDCTFPKPNWGHLDSQKDLLGRNDLTRCKFPLIFRGDADTSFTWSASRVEVTGPAPRAPPRGVARDAGSARAALQSAPAARLRTMATQAKRRRVSRGWPARDPPHSTAPRAARPVVCPARGPFPLPPSRGSLAALGSPPPPRALPLRAPPSSPPPARFPGRGLPTALGCLRWRGLWAAATRTRWPAS